MLKAVRFILVLFVLAFGMAHAANFSKNGYSYLQISGSTAKYSLSPTNFGSLQFPNTGWQVVGGALASGLTIGKSQNLPIPAGAQLPAVIKTVVPQKSVAKALVNPWGIVASMALQQTLGVLAETACVRIAGGVMVNNNGLWEECTTKLELQPYYECQLPTGGLAGSSDPKTAAEQCKPPGTIDPWGNKYLGYSHLVKDTCGTGCHSAFFDRQDYNSTNVQKVAPLALYESSKMTEKKDWKGTSPDNAQFKIEQELAKNPEISPSIFNDLYQQGIEFQDVSNPVIEGPSTVNAGDPITVTKTNPDGSTETSVQQYQRNYTYSGDTVTHTSTTLVNVTNNTVNNTTNTTITKITNPTNTPQQQIEVCGLPGKPACKIDETGTPEPEQLDQSKVDQAFSAIKTCLQNPISCLPSLPDLNWTFALPSGCSPIPLEGFQPFIQSIDICRFQPVFHDLMSMVWAAVGLFMAAGMMFREANGG